MTALRSPTVLGGVAGRGPVFQWSDSRCGGEIVGYYRMAAFFYNPVYLFRNPTTQFLTFCYPEVIWICGSFKRLLFPPPPLSGSVSTRRAMCFPLPPTSLARTGSLSRPQCRLPLGKCRSGSRLSTKGEATSHTAPSRALADPGVPLAVRLEGYAIGSHFQPEEGTRLGCMAQEAGGAGRVRAGAERRGARCGVGCFVWLFFFFFRERSLLWPRLKAAASSCPLPRPSAHTSWCRLQSAFR